MRLVNFIYKNLIAVWEKIKQINIKWLTSVPALLIVTIMIIVGNFDINLSKTTNQLLVGFIFFTASIISILIIARREYPFYQTIKGKPAVFLGIIGLLMSCPLTLAIFVKIILDIFER